MATLQKIRNHGVILLVIVGLAMLAFILGDFLNSGSSFFNRSREYVGVIDGNKIHYTEYEAAKEQLTEVYKIESGRSDFDEDLTSQIRNQVWNMMVMDNTLKKQTAAIGMDVTADELSELCIGQNPHELIRQRRAFYDETGQFSRDALVQFLASLEQETETPEQAANLKQAKTYWMYWENAVRLTQMQEKYTGLLQNMVTANNLDAKYQFNARQTSAQVEYVVWPYYAISDSLVSVSDKDIKVLYDQKKSLYKQTPNRSIEYVAFNILPSEQDYIDAEQFMKSLEEEFKTAEDVAVVVNPNSDIMYDARNYSINDIPEMYKDFAFGGNAQKNACTGLVFTDGTYSMARLMDCGYNVPDSVQLKAIATEEGQEDQELGWYTEAELTKQIAEPAFAGKKGTRFTVAVGLGEQTFEIMDIAKATPKVKLAILERKVTPSSKTYSVLYNEAKQFIVNNNTEEAFRSAAAEQGMTLIPAYNLDKNADKVASLKSSRPIVRWAFESKEGQISDVFECGDQFIVALLTEIKEGEYRPMSDVRGELMAEAINQKKAEIIKKELAGVTTLSDAAQKSNTTVQTADVSLDAYRFGNQGAEPLVVGKAMAMEANIMSEPIVGNAGVYMIQTGVKTTAEGEFNAEQEIQQANMRYAYSLAYQAVNMIQENAEIVDNRSNFQ